MPNWKKLIVSGSDATLNSLNITTNISGSDVEIDDWGSISGSLTVLTDNANSRLQNIVEDTTPQLGGNLDGNGFNIVLDSGNSFTIGNFSINTAPDFAGGNVTAITSQGNLTFGTSESNHDVIFQTLNSGGTLSNAIIANGGSGVDVSYDGTVALSTTADGVKIVGKMGVGVTNPKSKLDVDGGVKIGDDTDTASSDKVGTMRYRSDGSSSYADMCMQTGTSTYDWINIVEYTY